MEKRAIDTIDWTPTFKYIADLQNERLILVLFEFLLLEYVAEQLDVNRKYFFFLLSKNIIWMTQMFI